MWPNEHWKGQRKKVFEVSHEAPVAMLGLEKYIAQSGLDKKLYGLIKIRASQINGCAYCINMHVGCNVNRLSTT
jgi:alkylhydroperoxidase family enzyme